MLLLNYQENSPIYNTAAGLCLGCSKESRGEYVTMSICSQPESRKWNLLFHPLPWKYFCCDMYELFFSYSFLFFHVQFFVCVSIQLYKWNIRCNFYVLFFFSCVCSFFYVLLTWEQYYCLKKNYVLYYVIFLLLSLFKKYITL